MNLAHAGRFADAQELAAVQYREALEEHSPEGQAFFAWVFARTVGDRGDVQTAAGRAREAVALHRQLGRPHLANECLVHLALALALAGGATEASAVLDALSASGPLTLFAGAVDLLQARGWTAIASGDLPRGAGLLLEAVDRGDHTGDCVGEACALHGLARIGYAAEVADRLTRLAKRIEGVLVTARASHARALAAGDAVALEQVAGAFETMGANLLAAEAAADAAVAWRRNGQPKRATAAGQRATTLITLCEGATTPALRTIDSRARLTRAEHNVALLAAAGRSNRDIADEIHLSIRTVETHLQHVYEKLGVSSRAQLAGLLRSG